MDLKKNIILGISLVFIFIIIYSPHFNYGFPYHIDEWRGLEEGITIYNGHTYNNFTGLEIGFHLFIAILYFLFGHSLILFYKFFPALFGVLSSVILFTFIYRLTKKFSIAIFSIIFFASIKSNVNINGLWFFTPQTFVIPFIYLFFWLYYEGLKYNKIKMFLFSIITYLFIFISHPPSATFMIPIIIIFSIINYKFFKKNLLISSTGLIIPIVAFFFIKYVFKEFTFQLIKKWIIFNKGWSPFELTIKTQWAYSFVGLFLAFFGIWYCFKKKYYLFLLWVGFTYLLVKLFEIKEFTYLAPYQRMFYYFILVLPILSAFGLYYLIRNIKLILNKTKFKKYSKEIISIFIMIVFILAFVNYYETPKSIDLYRTIEEGEYEDLLYLEDIEEKGIIMTEPRIGSAIYPITGHEPVASYYFKINKRKDAELFYKSNCTVKDKLIKKNKVNYVIDKKENDCDWNLTYKNELLIYKID
ncbi:glycosyltransferase family 39 protein [Candidatus Woesearchaeota archaeon]|nr:glycosyltransferase family 39 protein [Candidatus Woesearchaeota archaeon]